MKANALVVLSTLALVAGGCFDHNSIAPEAEDPAGSLTVPAPDTARFERMARSADGGVGELSAGLQPVFVPAGSVDALAAALADAGSGGVVILRAGVHTESDGVVLSHPVTLLGEPGAVLRIVTDVDPSDYVQDAALHVQETHDVTIWGLEILPVGEIGSLAVYVERSDRVTVGFNRISRHATGILLHHADRPVLWGNRVEATDAFLEGTVAEADCIIVMNATGAQVLANDASKGLFGVFASGTQGTLAGNQLHGNVIGVIFCKVPDGGFQLPGGEIAGSEISATRWSATLNNCFDNLDAGYLVIDGASRNVLVANAASNNGTYDIELVGESTRFGFCTPTSFENVVRSTGPFRNLLIKDCGQDNTVIGGEQVDIGADPCDAPCPANLPTGRRIRMALPGSAR